MEFFSLFSTVFFNIAITFGLLLLIYLFFSSGIRARKDLKPVKYISYKKDHFQENFEFTCEFCGSKVSYADEKCPTCGGNFGKNKEYQLKKRAMHQRYLEYMKSQEEAILIERFGRRSYLAWAISFFVYLLKRLDAVRFPFFCDLHPHQTPAGNFFFDLLILM